MKKILKALGWILLFGIIGIQFFKPAKNLEAAIPSTHVSNLSAIPSDVNIILEKACFDCHTNNTRYPWYFNVQPVGIWMNGHIKEGKSKLNFSEYTNKRPRYKYHKMEEVIEMVEDGKMPLPSYTWTHKDAILTQEEKTKLIDWANSVMELLKTQYPIDSLVKKPAS